MSISKSIPLSNNQYSTPVSNTRNNNLMVTSPRSASDQPRLFIFTNPNIFSPPIASLKTELKKKNIPFEVISNANNLKQLISDNKGNCLAVIQSQRQSSTDISCIFPQNFIFPKSTSNVQIISYPNPIANTSFQAKNNPADVIATFKKFAQINETNRIRLKKVHTSKDIKFQQASINNIRQANSPLKNNKQFFEKLYFYDPPNENDQQYKILVQSLKNIQNVFPFSKLQDVTKAAKQLKKQNKILALVSHNQASVLKRHIQYTKKQKQIQFMIFGIDQPRKELMSPNMYFASNDALQIIDQLSKIGFNRMFDCRRKFQQLSTHKKLMNGANQQQFANSFTPSKFQRLELNRISQRSGASIFSNASSQQQRFVRNWIVDKNPNDQNQYQMIQENKEQYDEPFTQINANSRKTSLSKSRKSQSIQSNRIGEQQNLNGFRKSLDRIDLGQQNEQQRLKNVTQSQFIISKNEQTPQKNQNVKKIVKLTKSSKDQNLSNISSNNNIQNVGKMSYQQIPSNVIQETSEQYRGSNRQSIVNMDDNFYHYQGTNLTNSNHQIQQSDRGTGSGFNKVKNSTTVLEPIEQKVQKKRISYQNNYKIPEENRYISSSQYLIGENQRKSSRCDLQIQNPSSRLINTGNNYNQNNVYASMSQAPKIINGLTGQLQQKQSKSKAPLIINGLTGQLYPTQILRVSNGSHQQEINARYYSPSHVVRNTKITPQQVRMPHSSTSTTNELSNQNIGSNYYNGSSRQIRKQPQSSTSIKQHVNNVNTNTYTNPSYYNSSTSNRVNYISYNDPNKNLPTIKVGDYNTISSNNYSPQSRQNNYNNYYRNNAGIYNIPSTTNNALITTTVTPAQKITNYTQRRTITNNINAQDEDPFHENSNNKSKLKGSYINRQIDGKLDPFSPYQGSGIKVDKNSSQGRTKITYLNQANEVKSYNRTKSPSNYQVYDVKDNRVITNSPTTSNFNIYKGTSSNQTKDIIQRPTQVKRIIIGVDGVRRQVTSYQSTGQYQSSRNYQKERTNMATSPVRQIKLQQNKNYVSPGKINVTGGYTGYTGINLDQYEAHVDQNGRTIYKKKSIGILGQDSNINYRNNNHGDSLKKYEPTRRQYTNSPTRRGQEVKQSAYRRISVQKPINTAITTSNYNQSPNIKSYEDKSYQTYNENGYKVKKYVQEVSKYEQKKNTYGNNYNSLKQSSQSIRPLVYDSRSPTKVQTYRGQNVITYESPRRYSVQRKEYTQPKVQSSNFNRRIDSKEKPNIKKNLNNNSIGGNSGQNKNLKRNDVNSQNKEKVNQKMTLNNQNKKLQSKKQQIYEPSDASIMRRNNNRFGVNLYKKQKILDQSFQLNQLKSKIKSKIFTLSDLNKKMMVNRLIENENEIEEQKKKFSYIDTEINYFHFLIDEEIGHLKQWVQNYIFAKNDKLQVFRGVQDLYQKVKIADNDQYYNQNDIGFILATSEQITKINKNLLPENYYVVDLVSPAIFNGMQISQLDKKVKLSKLSNLKLAQKIILQSKLNHILLYQKKNIKDVKNTAYQTQVQQILNIFPDEEFIKQYYQGQITGELMDGLIDDFRFNRLYIICDEKEMKNVIQQLGVIQKEEGFPKQICKIICLPKDNQILKYQNLIQKHPEVAWITNVSKINDYKSLMKSASRQSQEDKQKEQNKGQQEKQKIFYHIRHKNLNQVLEKEFPGRFILESFTSLVQVQKKISKHGSTAKITKGINSSGKINSQASNYLILHPILSQEYLNFKFFKKIFMLGKSDKIQRRVIRVSTNAQLIELFRQ